MQRQRADHGRRLSREDHVEIQRRVSEGETFGVRTLPRIPFACSVQLACAQWGIHPTKLPDVCRRLRLPLCHHEAGSDAEACARIVLAAEAEGWRPGRRTMSPFRAVFRGRVFVGVDQADSRGRVHPATVSRLLLQRRG